LPHPLEDYYDLSARELLDAVNKRFRLKVALEGAVAEEQFEKKLRGLLDAGTISGYEHHDKDGYPDFTIWPPEDLPPLKVEVKNVRDSKEAYRQGGEDVAYKAETQKTRAATSDKSSRFYNVTEFDLVAVCLGKKTGDWTHFFFVRTDDLERHSEYPHKLATMQRVPLPESMVSTPTLGRDVRPWYEDLEELLAIIRGEHDG